MTLLAPTTFALALAVAAPALVVLYMLKLRRRAERIPSTLLWRRSVEDLVANSPFQRLRWSVLLLLQLLAAAALAAALGRPASRDADAVRGRVIVLIDRSASMNALVAQDDGADQLAGEPPRTRLDLARERVDRLIDRLGADDAGSQMMLVAFARQPILLSAFERSRGRLRDALATLVPTDEEADLTAALRLAEGFAHQGGGDEGADEPLPSIVIVTDGGVAAPRDRAGFLVPASSAIVELVGPRPQPWTATEPTDDAIGETPPAPVEVVDNVGITALAAERSYDDPATISLFARLSNAGAAPVETVVTIRQVGQAAQRRTVTIPAATRDGLGEVTLLERLEAPEQAVLIVSHSHADALPDDDVAAVVLPAPRKLRVALVTDGRPFDPFLRRLLSEAIDTQSSDDITSATDMGGSLREYELDTFVVASPQVDLVIFDRVAPPTLPDIPSWIIGAPPPGAASEPDLRGARRVLGWDRQHALMRHVDLDDLVHTAAALRLPDDWTVLAQGRDGPLFATTTRRGVRHAAIAFALAQSNLPILPTFPILVQNILDHLAAAGAGQTGRVVRPGDPVTVTAEPGATEILIEPVGGDASGENPKSDADSAARTIAIDAAIDGPGSRIALPSFERVGMRVLRGATPPDDIVAVSMLSDLESDIRAREAPLVIASSSGDARRAIATNADRWPWAVMAALVLLVLEWIAYVTRAGR